MRTITRTIFSVLLSALLLQVGLSASAQRFSVPAIEAQPGEQTELVVSLEEATAMTALQLTLHLPEGVAAESGSIATGVATTGHTLKVEELTNGDLLVFLYSMDLSPFADGELLRIPVAIGSEATGGRGSLYNVRMSTPDAVSHRLDRVEYTVTVAAAIKGDVNMDGHVDVGDIMAIINVMAGQPGQLNVTAADVNMDGHTDVGDIMAVINIMAGGGK